MKDISPNEKPNLSGNDQGIEGVTYAEPQHVSVYEGASQQDFEKGWEKYPTVWQGGGKLTEGGKLYSEGFSQCSAFVIKNPENNVGALFHIQDIDFEVEHQKLLRQFFLQWLDLAEVEPAEKGRLAQAISDVCKYNYPRTMKREEIAPRLKTLGIGAIRVQLFAGDNGRYYIDSRLRDSLLSFLGVELPSTRVFQDYRKHWAVLADFDANTVKINIPAKNKILEYDF